MDCDGAKRFSVLVTRPSLPQVALDRLRSKCEVEIPQEDTPMSPEELRKRIVGKDALFCLLTDSINKQVLDAAGPKLKVIATFSVGYDHIDLEECKKRGIKVGNTPDVLSDAVAEQSVGVLLATARRFMEATKEITNGGWAKNLLGPLWMCGTTLQGSTVGIVGLGRIGVEVLGRLSSFKVAQFLYTTGSKTPKLEVEKKYGNVKMTSFEELLKESDFVIVTCTLNPLTEKLFNAKAFELMKPSAVFVNSSRGGVVDQDALYQALATKSIMAAGLDVMTPEPLPVDHPLTKLPNCLLLPHISSATIHTRTNMALITVDNILNGLEGESAMPAQLC